MAERESLRPDLGRAVRATAGFLLPMLLGTTGWIPLEVSFMAIAAQNIAMVDVRGAYRLRLALLMAMTAVFAGAAALGAATADHFAAAILATGLMAVLGGLWRHLSPDYGASLAISSSLVFLIALGAPPGAHLAGSHGLAALLGGAWGILLQVANWPFRPQHPLRVAVSDSWVALGRLFEAMPPDDADPAGRARRIRESETVVRSTLDAAFAVLSGHGHARPSLLRSRLEALNLAAARLATRVVALNTALEVLMPEADFAALAPALQPVLNSLTNTARTVAIAVVSRQPAHLATAEVRLRRLENLLRVLQARVLAHTRDPATAHQVHDLLRQVAHQLPELLAVLRATIDRADERAAFSLELFDLDTWTLRPLASALNLNLRFDPALLRFTLRVAVLTMLGAVVYKAGVLAHGYWLPFTLVVVLQPDYGSTRTRAAQRVLGTLAGSVCASALLWFRPPPLLAIAAMGGIMFAFGFWLKRNYTFAVFFITLFIVLLTEAEQPLTIAFTLERLGSTAAGGVVALLAALFFWPVWERHRLPPILAQALRANRTYLRLLGERLATGGSYDAPAIAAKCAAEVANSAVFSSLQRMMGDPQNQQDGLEQAAALANGNQRLTRGLTVVALHLSADAAPPGPALAPFLAQADAALAALAATVEATPGHPRPVLAGLAEALESFRPPPVTGAADAAQTAWVYAQLTRAATELSAMLLVLQPEPAPPPTPAE